MSSNEPTAEIIESIFNKLRQQPANKVCFDCGAKNPTWSSVTFGVFICIDCSAVHRSLGVHLTFVRSINLDTNWTWIQLRQMQLGGNANAAQFFRQHNCTTTDTQQKYNSRAAQLYRDKLSLKSNQAMKVYGTQVDLDMHTEKLDENIGDNSSVSQKKNICDDTENNEFKYQPSQINDPSLKTEPSIDFLNSTVTMNTTKSTIGTRKIVQKKSSLGAKKSALGATKVKANFDEIEEKAINADKPLTEQIKSVPEDPADLENVRLAYQDISLQKQKKESEIKNVDPQKAKQLERLGMGISMKGGISHSAVNDMKTLYQESTTKVINVREREPNNDFFEEYSSSMHSSSKADNDLLNFDRNEYEPQLITSFHKSSSSAFAHINEQPGKSKIDTKVKSYDNDIAQKKFGSAKGISSSQFFNDEQKPEDRSAQLQRFQGSNSISSADYFGNDSPSSNPKSYDTGSYHDMDDVKESVRQGVTKVAGRLSSLANDVMSSLQEKYGY